MCLGRGEIIKHLAKSPSTCFEELSNRQQEILERYAQSMRECLIMPCRTANVGPWVASGGSPDLGVLSIIKFGVGLINNKLLS